MLDYGNAMLAEQGRKHLRRIGSRVSEVPAWSRDGRKLTWPTFVATRSEYDAHDDLVVSGVDGGTPKRIQRAPFAGVVT
jgi:hypothetical protein